MKIDIGIVAHQKRFPQASTLYEKIGANFISLDEGDLNCEANHVQAWEQFESTESEWGVVLEDDAVPVVNFRRQLAEVLKVANTPIVSLYLGRKRPPHWQDSIAQVVGANTSFIVSDTLLNCVATCVHSDYLPDIRHAVRTQFEKQSTQKDVVKLPIDEMITQWMKMLGLHVSYTNPSLVDHADQDTLIDYHLSEFQEDDMSTREKGRRAWRVGTREKWDNTCITLPQPGTQVATTVNDWPIL